MTTPRSPPLGGVVENGRPSESQRDVPPSHPPSLQEWRRAIAAKKGLGRVKIADHVRTHGGELTMEHVSAPVLTALRAMDTAPDQPKKSDGAPLGVSANPRFTPPVNSALALLMDAATCAQDVGAELWQFSVEISAFLRSGLTTNECRWLVAKGFAKHACEMTTPDADRRVFQPCTNLALPKRTCFVITDRGMTCATELLRSQPKRHTPGPKPSTSHLRQASGNGEPQAAMRTGDSDRQQLRVGRVIVKELKV